LATQGIVRLYHNTLQAHKYVHDVCHEKTHIKDAMPVFLGLLTIYI